MTQISIPNYHQAQRIPTSDKEIIDYVRNYQIIERIRKSQLDPESIFQTYGDLKYLKNKIKKIEGIPLYSVLRSLKIQKKIIREVYNVSTRSIARDIRDQNNINQLIQTLFIYQLLKNESNIHGLVDSIDIFVHSIASDDPSISVNHAIKKLPLHRPTEIHIDYGMYVEQLYEIQQSRILNSASKKLIIEYLMNMMDPAGAKRISIIHSQYKSEKNIVDFTRQLSNIAQSLSSFGILKSPLQLTDRFSIQPFFFKQKQSFTHQPFERDLIQRLLTQNEIIRASHFIKIEICIHIEQLGLPLTTNDPELLIQTIEQLQVSYLTFINRFKSAILAVESVDHQAKFLENFLMISASLISQGEMELSFLLFVHLLEGTRETCLEAWDIIMQRRRLQYNFVKHVVSRSEDELDTFIQERESFHILIPIFFRIKNELLDIKNRINSLFEEFTLSIQKYTPDTNNIRDAIDEILVDDFFNSFHIYESYEYLFDCVECDFENDPSITEYVMKILSDHIQLAERAESILNELDSQLLALQLYYLEAPRDPLIRNFYQTYIRPSLSPYSI